jgi:hypothetical protein
VPPPLPLPPRLLTALLPCPLGLLDDPLAEADNGLDLVDNDNTRDGDDDETNDDDDLLGDFIDKVGRLDDNGPIATDDAVEDDGVNVDNDLCDCDTDDENDDDKDEDRGKRLGVVPLDDATARGDVLVETGLLRESTRWSRGTNIEVDVGLEAEEWFDVVAPSI